MARPAHLIITMIKWIRTSRLSIKNSHSAVPSCACVIDSGLVEVTQDKKMSRCHLPRVVYHQVYNVY